MIPPFFFLPFRVPAVVVLGLWFVLQFFTQSSSGVATLAHIGGFVFGVAGRVRARADGRLPAPDAVRAIGHLNVLEARRSAQREARAERGDEPGRERAEVARRRTRARGSGIGSSPPAPTIPDSTSANGTPSAAANAPSVDGRSPIITTGSPKRSRTSAAIAGSGLPATSGRAPAAVATAATSAPAPGSSPSAAGIGRVEVGRDETGAARAPRRRRAAAGRSRSRGASPTTTASAGSASTVSKPAACSASTTPGPARREHGRAPAAAGRGRAARPRPGRSSTTSSGSASTPAAARRATLSAHAPARVVRQEHDPQPGVAQLRDAGGRALDRGLAAPDHAVEVAAHDRTAVPARVAHADTPLAGCRTLVGAVGGGALGVGAR